MKREEEQDRLGMCSVKGPRSTVLYSANMIHLYIASKKMATSAVWQSRWYRVSDVENHDNRNSQQRHIHVSENWFSSLGCTHWTLNKQVNSSLCSSSASASRFCGLSPCSRSLLGVAHLLQVTFTVSERKAATRITAGQANSQFQKAMLRNKKY